MTQESKVQATVIENDFVEAKRYIAAHAASLEATIRSKWPQYPFIFTLFEQVYRSNAEETWQLFTDDSTVYVTTGDIPRMWLRDSAAQMQAYVPLLAASRDEVTKGALALRNVFRGVLRRQIRFFVSDVYASAFYPDSAAGRGHGPSKLYCRYSTACPDCGGNESSPDCGQWTYQHDFELDSPCAVIRLHVEYARATGDYSIYDDEAKEAFVKMLQLFEIEQNHATKSLYAFHKKQIMHPSNSSAGLIWGFARPSDDQQVYGFNVPGNMVVVAALDDITSVANNIFKDVSVANRAKELALHIRKGLVSHGIIRYEGSPYPRPHREHRFSVNRTAYSRRGSLFHRNHASQRKYTHEQHRLLLHDSDMAEYASDREPLTIGAKIWAFEVDGYGKSLAMDDANLPNLLSLPLSGFKLGHNITFGHDLDELSIYNATRRFILSKMNPSFYRNGNHTITGLGSVHATGIRSRPGRTCLRHCVWTLGLIVQSMTATTAQERDHCLRVLYETTDGTYLMHEGFSVNDPARYNRDSFGWANAMMSLLILNYLDPNATEPSSTSAWASMRPQTRPPLSTTYSAGRA